MKFYYERKRFGFIQPEGGDKDVFVHASAQERCSINGLSEGQKVFFETRVDLRNGKIAVDMIELA